MDYQKSCKDPIYDTCSDVSSEGILDFEILGNRNIEKVTVEILYIILQPYAPINNRKFGCHVKHIYAYFFQPSMADFILALLRKFLAMFY